MDDGEDMDIRLAAFIVEKYAKVWMGSPSSEYLGAPQSTLPHSKAEITEALFALYLCASDSGIHEIVANLYVALGYFVCDVAAQYQRLFLDQFPADRVRDFCFGRLSWNQLMRSSLTGKPPAPEGQAMYRLIVAQIRQDVERRCEQIRPWVASACARTSSRRQYSADRPRVIFPALGMEGADA
jgi:hypothetical protein